MSKENIFAKPVGRNFMVSGLLVVRMGKWKKFSYGVLWYGRCSDFGCCYHAAKCDSAIDSSRWEVLKTHNSVVQQSKIRSLTQQVLIYSQAAV